MTDTVKIADYLEYLNTRVESAQQELERIEKKQVDDKYKLYHLETTACAKSTLRNLEGDVCRCKYKEMQGDAHIQINHTLISPNDFYYWYVKLKNQ